MWRLDVPKEEMKTVEATVAEGRESMAEMKAGAPDGELLVSSWATEQGVIFKVYLSTCVKLVVGKAMSFWDGHMGPKSSSNSSGIFDEHIQLNIHHSATGVPHGTMEPPFQNGCFSKPIIINVSGVNTHLPTILMFTRVTKF